MLTLRDKGAPLTSKVKGNKTGFVAFKVTVIAYNVNVISYNGQL